MMKSKYLYFYVYLVISEIVESLPNLAAMPELPSWLASTAWQVLSTNTTQF